jgi:hypothetical protein
VRRAIFEDGSVDLRQTPGVKRRGRPRQKWANFVHGHAVAAAGGEGRLQESLLDQAAWAIATRHYLKSVKACEQTAATGSSELAGADWTSDGNADKEGASRAFATEERR